MRRKNYGFTLLEVVASAAFLTLGMIAALRVYTAMTKQAVVTRSLAAGEQVAQLVAATVFRRVQNYLYAAATTAGCQDASLPAANRFSAIWSTDTPEGFRFAYVNSAKRTQLLSLLPDTAGMASVALTGEGTHPRCDNDTISRFAGNLSTQPGVYFCLSIENAPSEVGHLDDIRSAQPAFAEFRFLTKQTATGNTLDCNTLATFLSPGSPRPTPQPASSRQGELVASLHYTLYWTTTSGRDRISRSRSGALSQTWLW